MAYSSFTLDDLELKFQIINRISAIFPKITLQEIPEDLKKNLEKNRELSIRSEKARSELIVTPILLALREMNNKFFTIYSGDYLEADKERGLTGECDFIIAKETRSYNISFPIFQVVEAKKHDLEIGIPQCAAQMVGAKIYNEKKGKNLEVIYGCVTTGTIYQFLKLEGNEILIHENLFYLNNLEELLGAFQYVINYYKNLGI